jgi:hypothetical protein
MRHIDNVPVRQTEEPPKPPPEFDINSDTKKMPPASLNHPDQSTLAEPLEFRQRGGPVPPDQPVSAGASKPKSGSSRTSVSEDMAGSLIRLDITPAG